MEQFANQRQEMRAAVRMIPEQILSGEILQLPFQDLERRLMAEFELNPALALEDVTHCPACGEAAERFPCPSCGFRPAAADDVPIVVSESWETYRERVHEAEGLEPFGTVASRRCLRDDLREQFLVQAPPDDIPVGLYLIECLDADGYMREPLLEVAQRFRRSVPQVEVVLSALQRLEPAGVAARDLRECLLLQASRRDDPTACLVARILEEAWQHLESRRVDRISQALGVPEDEVGEGLDWMRANLAPHPGRAWHDEWGRLSPLEEPQASPDVIIRAEGDGFVVEIVVSSRFRVGLDPTYVRFDQRSRQTGGPDADHVRRAVANARWLVDAVMQRRRTLHKVMTAVAAAQDGFLRHGRGHLKPLMQKTIAASIGMHESTVCRALADKLVLLPCGETVPTTVFFDASAPVKEVLLDLIGREDPARPLSDSRLATLLQASGHKIARRTVAKYREALRVPQVELRQRA